MPVSKFETMAYVTADQEEPLAGQKARENLFAILFSNFGRPPGSILVAGSGTGTEILALADLTPEPLIALDCNVPLDPSVRAIVGARVTEEKSFFHDFLLTNQTPLAVIVVSTGRPHGLTTQEEYAALKSSVTPGGIIICSWYVELNRTQMQPEFTATKINLPYYTTVFTQV